MVATVSGDNGALVRSRVVVELVPDLALVQTLIPSMVETTVLAWDRLLSEACNSNYCPSMREEYLFCCSGFFVSLFHIFGQKKNDRRVC